MISSNVSAEYLQSFVDRIERLTEEKQNIADDIKEVFAEAKAHGYDVKTLREIIKLRKLDADDREEQEFLLETYQRALGMIPPLASASSNNASTANDDQASNSEESFG